MTTLELFEVRELYILLTGSNCKIIETLGDHLTLVTRYVSPGVVANANDSICL